MRHKWMTVQIFRGDCREVLCTLPPESVHCVVTSPPYWGLRDYGTAQWDGGDAGCDHSAAKIKGRADYGFGEKSQLQTSNVSAGYSKYRESCDCGARRIDSQLGLEPTLGEHVQVMVEVFREVRRVLRKDGTLWLNYGTVYASSANGSCDSRASGLSAAHSSFGDVRESADNSWLNYSAMRFKPKDLISAAWIVALALQQDGWFLRQDIVWSKLNPMPESVTDRCTKSHEYIFLLSKSGTYFYDADAIRETTGTEATWDQWQAAEGRKAPSGTLQGGVNVGFGSKPDSFTHPNGRNKRSVWEIATAPFSEAHFATFPPALIEPCILAGCPKGGTVLDPFFGAGTTGLVADRLGRNCIGIELNLAYAEMAERRIRNDAGMFANVAFAGDDPAFTSANRREE